MVGDFQVHDQRRKSKLKKNIMLGQSQHELAEALRVFARHVQEVALSFEPYPFLPMAIFELSHGLSAYLFAEIIGIDAPEGDVIVHAAAAWPPTLTHEEWWYIPACCEEGARRGCKSACQAACVDKHVVVHVKNSGPAPGVIVNPRKCMPEGGIWADEPAVCCTFLTPVARAPLPWAHGVLEGRAQWLWTDDEDTAEKGLPLRDHG